MLRLKYRPVIRALARALVCAAAPLSASLAQTGDDETGGGNLGVAGAPRPKVEKDAQYYLGRGGYDVKVFFQQGQSFENIRAHVYYEPLIYLVTDESGGLRHDIRTNERRWQLILYFRVETDDEFLESTLRKKLTSEARMTHPKLKQIENSQFAYRIDPITTHRSSFVSARLRDEYRSHYLSTPGAPVAFTARGNYPIYFDFDSEDDARSFVADLDAGRDYLRFEYEFAGVSDKVCEATFTSRQLQIADKESDSGGPGGEGYVTRDFVAALAERVIRSSNYAVRCDDPEWSHYLFDKLIARIGEPDTLSLSDGWKTIDEMNVFDPADFRADFVKSAKDIEKENVRNLVMDASASAESDSRSTEIGGGLAASYGLFTIGGSAHESDSRANAESEARKFIQDEFEKRGVLGEWEGATFVPKTLEAYRTEELNRKWSNDDTITYSFMSSGNAVHVVDLHLPDARYEVIGPDVVDALRTEIARLSDRVDNVVRGARNYSAAGHTHNYSAARHTHNYSAAGHTHNYSAARHTHNYSAAGHTHKVIQGVRYRLWTTSQYQSDFVTKFPVSDWPLAFIADWEIYGDCSDESVLPPYMYKSSSEDRWLIVSEDQTHECSKLDVIVVYVHKRAVFSMTPLQTVVSRTSGGSLRSR